MKHHQAGRLPQALQAYRDELEVRPCTTAAQLAGRVLFELERADEAIEMLRLAVRLDPDNGDAWNDLGNILSSLGQDDDAIAAYRHSVRCSKNVSLATNNLANTLMHQQRFGQAIEVLEAALASDRCAAMYQSLGKAYRAAGRLDDAREALRQATGIDPNDPDSHRELVAVLREQGRQDELCETLQNWRKCDPENPVPTHLIQALQAASGRASDGYIRKVFDEYAESFEESLGKLSYCVPEHLDRMLGQHTLENATVLDAGCGTGLCAPYLRPRASRLVGVDLSEKMIDKAQQRNLYDELSVAELTEFMLGHPAEYDLIQAADTLIYFGELQQVFAAMVVALRPGGSVLFSLEAGQSETYAMGLTGRFSHGKQYVMDQLELAGLRLHQIQTLAIRVQAAVPVEGWCIWAIQSDP
ncbi:tetratricopeptide repeat protein [Stieleria sp. TO1_6]|uniref:tetratricopeptide repeat protein n=1 Tax=Stieleria tagensis TaxID=2956795 RepID=UPI00209B1CAF|nr:tetratricopeptide repeat protein [Stieleria tagensis]MCO8125227.1 tetratricopeptide repeat protein [Stieleria tagensis]